MRLLLDTHAFLWYALDDSQLSPVAREMLSREDVDAFISPASYWEIAIKITIGKYILNAPYEEFWQRTVEDNGFQIIPILPSHTAVLTHLPYHHKDPFDRLIVSQAIAERMSLLSADMRLDTYSIQRIW